MRWMIISLVVHFLIFIIPFHLQQHLRENSPLRINFKFTEKLKETSGERKKIEEKMPAFVEEKVREEKITDSGKILPSFASHGKKTGAFPASFLQVSQTEKSLTPFYSLPEPALPESQRYENIRETYDRIFSSVDDFSQVADASFLQEEDTTGMFSVSGEKFSFKVASFPSFLPGIKEKEKVEIILPGENPYFLAEGNMRNSSFFLSKTPPVFFKREYALPDFSPLEKRPFSALKFSVHRRPSGVEFNLKSPSFSEDKSEIIGSFFLPCENKNLKRKVSFLREGIFSAKITFPPEKKEIFNLSLHTQAIYSSPESPESLEKEIFFLLADFAGSRGMRDIREKKSSFILSRSAGGLIRSSFIQEKPLLPPGEGGGIRSPHPPLLYLQVSLTYLEKKATFSPQADILPSPDAYICEKELSCIRQESRSELIAEYLKKIMFIIEENKTYPPSARRKGSEGRVGVSFTLLSTGEVVEVRVFSPCKDEDLNRATRDLIYTLSPFPPFPEGMGKKSITLKMEVVYELKEEF